MFDDKRILNRLSWSIYPKHHIKGIETRKPSLFIDEYNRHTWQIHWLISKILDLIMSRPNKTGLSYFPMDVDLFQDIRIRKLIKYQSGKAITVYALLLCLIYQRGYYMRWDEELPFIISEQTGFEEAYILEVIRSCMTLGLFSKKLYDDEQIITSKGIQERYLYICKLLKRRVSITEYLLIDEEKELVTSQETGVISGKTPVISEETALNSVKMQQKKRKEKEIKEISLLRDKEKFPPPEVVDKTLSECYDELSCDRSWIEIVTMNTRNSGHKDFTIDMFGMYLKRFFEKLQNEGEVRKSPKDVKSHFSRWLNIELKKKGNYEPKPITNNIYEQKRIDSERRKSKLMAEFAEADAKFLAEQEAKRKAVGFIGEISDTFPDGG